MDATVHPTASNWRGRNAFDIITGFKGTITARVEYLNGCTQYCLTPRMKDGETKQPKDAYIDEGQVMLMPHDPPVEVLSSPTGGPQSNCPPH